MRQGEGRFDEHAPVGTVCPGRVPLEPAALGTRVATICSGKEPNGVTAAAGFLVIDTRGVRWYLCRQVSNEEAALDSGATRSSRSG